MIAPDTHPDLARLGADHPRPAANDLAGALELSLDMLGIELEGIDPDWGTVSSFDSEDAPLV